MLPFVVGVMCLFCFFVYSWFTLLLFVVVFGSWVFSLFVVVVRCFCWLMLRVVVVCSCCLLVVLFELLLVVVQVAWMLSFVHRWLLMLWFVGFVFWLLCVVALWCSCLSCAVVLCCCLLTFDIVRAFFVLLFGVVVACCCLLS